jgi:hypothetical protein
MVVNGTWSPTFKVIVPLVDGRYHTCSYLGPALGCRAYPYQPFVSTAKPLSIGSGQIQVEIDKTKPLSIMTVGYELDQCKMPSFPHDIQPRIIQALSAPSGDPYPALKDIEKELYSSINAACTSGQERNDPIGSINRVYMPPSYSSGINTVASGGYPTSDFEVTYNIEPIPEKYIGPQAQK